MYIDIVHTLQMVLPHTKLFSTERYLPRDIYLITYIQHMQLLWQQTDVIHDN